MPGTAAFRTEHTFLTAEETSAFARALAPSLGAGDVILLHGDLGSGKTHFARALIQERLARAGLTEDVPSPTFTLVQVYDDGETELWHCDLYRLGGPEDVIELGLDEAFSTSVCLVEWPDRLQDLTPEGALDLTLRMTDEAGRRKAVFESADPAWEARVIEALSHS